MAALRKELTATALGAVEVRQPGAGQRLPRLPRRYVARQRFWDRLDVATTGAVTMVVAPVGAGKTLGVAGWLQRTGRATSTVWVSAGTDLTGERLAALLAPVPGTVGDERLVVVDDAQRLPSSAIGYLDLWLAGRPEDVRLLLLSQWDLPVARLVPELCGDLSVLRGDLLRLDETEAAALVSAHARTDSPEVAEAIMSHTQGWCAAVVLTARAVAVSPDPVAAAWRFAEGGAGVADRVGTEVFAALSTRQRHLLLCVAGEGSVTASTAAHLCHDDRAAETLTELETTGLLVTRVSRHTPDEASGEPAYRIHPLLAEVVRRRLAVGGVDVARARGTVRRAVRLDLARGETVASFARLVAVNEPDEAARVLCTEGPALVLRGQGSTIRAFARRHPDIIEAHPSTWLTLAYERMLARDLAATRHWADRILAVSAPEDVSLEVACVRLIRSRLDLEPMTAAVLHGERALTHPDGDPRGGLLVGLLQLELGCAQNWLGDLAEAERHLGAVVMASRLHGLPALTAMALSHLALTQLMLGREHVCTDLVERAVEALAEPGWAVPGTTARLGMLRELVDTQKLPWPIEPADAQSVVDASQDTDPTTRFWTRILHARRVLLGGSVSGAEHVLAMPLETPSVQRHLRVPALVERGVHAALSSDPDRLAAVAEELQRLTAASEATWVLGLRADLLGDPRGAEALFAAAGAEPSAPQPGTTAMALACRAQLLDALGDTTQAVAVLRDAVHVSSVRGNALPFFGWTRHGTGMGVLLHRLEETSPTPWGAELAAASDGEPGLTSYFAPITATPHERSQVAETMRPLLSPRERDVLQGLARGSTYADIAANLFVSDNTVKTHVSSLYAKLAVNRRSDALAVARTMHLL